MLGGAEYPWEVKRTKQQVRQYPSSKLLNQPLKLDLELSAPSASNYSHFPLQHISPSPTQGPFRHSSVSVQCSDSSGTSDCPSSYSFAAIPPYNVNSCAVAQQRAVSDWSLNHDQPLAHQQPLNSVNALTTSDAALMGLQQSDLPPVQHTFGQQSAVQCDQARYPSVSHAHPPPSSTGRDPPHSTSSSNSNLEGLSLLTYQSDGPSDGLLKWKAEVSKRREASFKNSGRSDEFIRHYVKSRATEQQGNGGMRPLSELPQVDKKQGQNKLSGLHQVPQESAAVAPYDGPDENSINSDLDDSVDETSDDHSEEGQLVLCTYEKVHRVRSRFRCIFKDGMMSVNDKMCVCGFTPANALLVSTVKG